MTQEIILNNGISITNLNQKGVINSELIIDFLDYADIQPNSMTERNYKTYLKHFVL